MNLIQNQFQHALSLSLSLYMKAFYITGDVHFKSQEVESAFSHFLKIISPFIPFHVKNFEVLIDSFSFRTGPSDEQLDPVEWRLEASNDQNTWKVLHSQDSPTGRKVTVSRKKHTHVFLQGNNLRFFYSISR